MSTYSRQNVPSADFYGFWDGKTCTLRISGLKIFANYTNPKPIAQNIKQELIRAFNDSDIKDILRCLPLREGTCEIGGTLAPIVTSATNAAGIAEAFMAELRKHVLNIVGAENYRPQDLPVKKSLFLLGRRTKRQLSF